MNRVVPLLIAVSICSFPALAQETSGDFSDGSILVGYDSRTCDASLEGAVRYAAGTSDGNWAQVGNALGIPAPGDIATLDSSTIAWVDPNNDELRTYRFNGSNWSKIGFVGTGAATSLNVTALDSDTVIIVRSNLNNKYMGAVVWNGANWTYGSYKTYSSSTSGPLIAALTSRTFAHFDPAFAELRTYEWDGLMSGNSGITQIGNGLAIPGSSFVAMTALDSSTLVVNDLSTDDLRVYKWNGTDWSQVGNALPLANGDHGLATLSGTTIVLADAINEELRTYSWDGANWTEIGTAVSLPTSTWISGPKLAALDNPTIAYFDRQTDYLRTYQSGVSSSGKVQTCTPSTGPSGCPNIGDVCSDGSIFAGDTNLYVTDVNQSTGIQWKNPPAPTPAVDDINPDSNTDGQANHDNRSGTLSHFPAFELCENLTRHSYSDWYLPAKNELNVLYTNRTAIGGFTSDLYWSSTEVDSVPGDSWSQFFFNGSYADNLKTTSLDVRCTRRFNSSYNWTNWGE